MASKNDNAAYKAEALEKLTEHNRDFLKLDITLPLGNKALKNVHTNQYLFTELSENFSLANWTILAKALNAKSNRYSGYVENRWYIESNTITVDLESNKAEMKLGVNAFPSSYENYLKANKEYQDAFKEEGSNNNNNGNGNQNTTNAVTTGDNPTVKDGWWGKWVTEMVRKNVGTETDVLKKCKIMCDVFKKHAIYEGYNNMQKTGGSVNNLEPVWNANKHLNCGDGANFLSAFMSCCGATTSILLTYDYAHYIVRVRIDGKDYWCDQAGLEGSHDTRGWNETWHGYRSGYDKGRYV